MDRKEFSQDTKLTALLRQKNKCAACAEVIVSLNQIGKKSHKYGEGSHAHHMKHCQQGGTNLLANCVILCESCHYSAHNGGNYQNSAKFLTSTAKDYPYFIG